MTWLLLALSAPLWLLALGYLALVAYFFVAEVGRYERVRGVGRLKTRGYD